MANGQTYATLDILGIRRVQNRTRIDDDCDTEVDEAGEAVNSVGAFDATCSCAARRLVVW